MKMANAMFPPSSVEPAVASATGAQTRRVKQFKVTGVNVARDHDAASDRSRLANTSECYWLLHQHKHSDGRMRRVTRAGRCLLTQAQNTRRRWGVVYPLDGLKETSCVWTSAEPGWAHRTTHTRTDSPSNAWLPKQSWVAVRNHSVSQVATGKVTQSLPRCSVPGWIPKRGRSHSVVCCLFSYKSSGHNIFHLVPENYWNSLWLGLVYSPEHTLTKVWVRKGWNCNLRELSLLKSRHFCSFTTADFFFQILSIQSEVALQFFFNDFDFTNL